MGLRRRQALRHEGGVNLRERILAAIPAQGIHRRALLNALSHEYPPALDMAIASMLRDGTIIEREPEVYYRPLPASEPKAKRPRQRKLALSPTTQKRGATGGAITECVMCGQFKRKAADEVCGECAEEMDAIFAGA